MNEWLGRREDWLGKGVPGRNPKQRREKVYSIAEVAEMLSISRVTVYKYLSLEAPEDAIIDPGDWFRLPGGHIRVRERALMKLIGDN